ncbi:MAG: glycosyltransferase, partial [Chloroflexota bacterium]
IYNERYVVVRLLEAVAALDYPRDQLTIQLLDDSDDDTTRVATHAIARLRTRGLTVQHIRREDRTGYKAGALVAGMAASDTPYYAVFDADFIPPPDFLQRTMPHLLADATLGMVQGRWGHLNTDENALTAAQTLAIDTHFVIEQTARSRGGLLLNFNGTGGVWRADCIREAGGWRDNTLTEDFDLSYRAQLAGWRMKTLPDLVVPGELPPQLAAFKQQQARWARGSTQVLRLMLPRLWASPRLTFPQRLMGTLHLCQYMPYPILVALPVLSVVLLALGVLDDLSLGFMTFSGVVPPLMYAVSQVTTRPDWPKRLRALPALILFGTGVAVSNTAAVIAGFTGTSGVFRRTPKFAGEWLNSDYSLGGGATAVVEWLLCGLTLWGAWLALDVLPIAAPYLLLSSLSYGTVAAWGLLDRWRLHVARRDMAAVGD